MEITNIARLLGFTPAWFDLGVVDDTTLLRLKAQWDDGQDPHTEHYRYGAFREYVASHRPLTPETASALFELGAADQEPGMGSAMMVDIVYLPECPDAVLEAARECDRKPVVRAVEKRKKE